MTQVLDAPAATEPAGEEDEPLEPDPDGKALFNRDHYQREGLAIDMVDGQPIDKIRINFAGSIMLDRSAVADVALFNKLLLGKVAECRVSGKVSKIGTGYTTNREGDLDAIVGERTLKIDTIQVLDASAL